MHSSVPQVVPALSIREARKFALNQIDARISHEPEVAAAFWNEVNGSTAPPHPEITVFFCFLVIRGVTFRMFEFVSGQTLEELCTDADPNLCERAIPLFCRMLDACDVTALENQNSREPLGVHEKDGDSPRLSNFGIARATAAATRKLYGTIMIQPDGSWSEEILSDESGRSTVYPLLVAVYQQLLGDVPCGTSLSPSQINSFSKYEFTAPTKAGISKHTVPYLIAIAAGTLLVLSSMGLGHVLAGRVESQETGSLQLPSTAIAKTAHPIESVPLQSSQEAEASSSTAGIIRTQAVTAGPTRGPHLILRISPEYPPQARQQGISGDVKLEITIAETGFVRSAKVLSGNQLLARSAIEAVKKWLYEPALVNGKPSLVTTEVEFTFDRDHQN